MMENLISVVDFSVYSITTPADEVETDSLTKLAREICTAFTDVGFVYLKNHGIPQSSIQNMISETSTFFEKPESTKAKYTKTDGNYGWIAKEHERCNVKRPAGDLRECYQIYPYAPACIIPNDIQPNFYSSIMEMFKHCQNLSVRILDLIAIGFDCDRTYFQTRHQKIGQKGNLSCIKTNYYNPITTVKEGQIRCGEHSDFGTITLLFQDNIGGLEVQPRGYDYFPVPPIDDTVIVNLGDMLQRWTADKLQATKHRVIIPKEEALKSKCRQSIAFFLQPDDDALIECLDGSKKYEPISSRDYLLKKLDELYNIDS